MNWGNSISSGIGQNDPKLYPLFSYQLIPQFQYSSTPTLVQFPLYSPSNPQIYTTFCPSLPNSMISNMAVMDCKGPQIKQWDQRSKQKKQSLQLAEDKNLEEEQKERTKIITCQCTKSNCAKQYCFCFKNGVQCNQNCGCVNCRNSKESLNERRIMKKKEIVCSCNRSRCSKRYCQCFAANRKCGDSCKCTHCQN